MCNIIKIFIVEDDRSIQQLLREILEFGGYQVVGSANNGQEAIDMYQLFSEKPDIILMDHRMPIKNGLDASQEILKIEENSKIIFTSADIDIKEDALSLGVINFLEKPFTPKKLIKKIKKISSNYF